MLSQAMTAEMFFAGFFNIFKAIFDLFNPNNNFVQLTILIVCVLSIVVCIKNIFFSR